MIKKWTLILILWLLLTIPVVADCNGYCIYLPLIQKCDVGIIPMSDWKIIIPETTINKVLNPSAETTGNFAAAGGATVTRSTTYQHYGLYSYRVQTAADNAGIELTLGSLANAIHYVTMRIRGNRPDEWDWSLDDATYTAPTLLEQIDSNWALYGLQFPAAQANGSTTLYIDQNGAGGGDFYIDGIQVEEKEYWTTYCDGTQDGCEWLGAANASTSQRSAVSRAGGRLYDLQDDYGLNVGSMIGGGFVSQDLSVDEYAILPGGELNNIKVQSRSFTLGGVISGTSQSDFHSKKQTLESIFAPDAYPKDVNGYQPARLQYQGATVHKQIAVQYEQGLEGRLAADDPCFWERVAIRFVSDDPFFYEIGESAALLDTNDSATFRTVARRLRSTGQWNELGPPDAAGTYTGVLSLAQDDTYVYMGGDFLNFNNIAAADYIVRYEKATGTYSALDVGLNGNVYALTLGPDGTLYAGGEFTNAGGDANADYIAQWDGTNWSAVGTGTDDAVWAIVFGLDGTLYAGGEFANAGGGAAAYIASWDGSAWSALGSGMNNIVLGLTIGLDGTLYAGGIFTTAGGTGANRIASWDGSAWSALGSGTNAQVYGLAIDDNGILYISGLFTTAGGITVNYIAQWDGINWSALGSGLGGVGVQSWDVQIAPDGIIYTVGSFTSAGGISLGDGIARWNGYTWAHLDIDAPSSPNKNTYAIIFGNPDPVVEQNYDIWFGFRASGTGYFAGLVSPSNAGNVPVFPKIVYNRSGGTTAVIETLRNEKTGKELLFNYSLLDGETLTIDLAPTKKSIISSMFGLRQDAVLPNSDFGEWALLAGSNDVTSFVNVTGAPTVTAYMLWKDAFLGQD